MKQTGPCYQSADSIETQAPDKDGFVSEMAKDPVRMTERCQWIGTYSALQLHINTAADHENVRTEVCRL